MKVFSAFVTVLFISGVVQSIPYLERYGRPTPYLEWYGRSQLTEQGHESKNEKLKRGNFGGTILGKRIQYYENMWPFSVSQKTSKASCKNSFHILILLFRFIAICEAKQFLSLKSSFVTKPKDHWLKNRPKIDLETACLASTWRVSTKKTTIARLWKQQ